MAELQGIQDRLNALTLEPEEFKSALPAPVKARVDALEKLQSEHDDVEAAFQAEKRALEMKYEAKFAPMYIERAAIVKGEKQVEGGDAAGIPNFWQIVLMRCDVTRDIMNEKDIEVLKYLADIKCEVLRPPPPKEGEEEEEEGEHGFKLLFFFDENPFFTNKVLEKTYIMMDEDEPVLEQTKGTEINWNAGKNVTVKLMKKKPKKGSKPDAKPITKTEPVDSFFNFFSPPAVPEEGTELEEPELEALHEEIENDYEMGEMIKTELIPNAVRWFTGEAQEDEDDEFDMGDEDEDDDDDEDDEDEEEEASRSPARRGGGRGRGRRGGPAAAAAEQQECKQQ